MQGGSGFRHPPPRSVSEEAKAKNPSEGEALQQMVMSVPQATYPILIAGQGRKRALTCKKIFLSGSSHRWAGHTPAIGLVSDPSGPADLNADR